MTFTSGVNLNISYKLEVVMMLSNNGSSIAINVELWPVMFVLREPACVWGEVVYRKSLYFLLNLTMDLKLLYKSNLLVK